MLYQCSYPSVRDSMAPGDVIAFGGRGLISDAIKFFTKSPVSHVGVVLECLAGQTRRIQCLESTTLDGISGVQETWLSERIEAYGGLMWWIPLSASVRLHLDAGRFVDTLREQKGKEYDYRQVAHHAWDLLHLFAQGESPEKFFCSELVAFGLKAAGVLPIWIDSAEIRPVDLLRFKVFAPDYAQLKGPKTEIPGINSLDPRQWKNG